MKSTKYKDPMAIAVSTLVDVACNTDCDKTKVNAALGLVRAENIKLQRERVVERESRYVLLYPPNRTNKSSKVVRGKR